MLVYAGIDEAGYGPLLGPLCVASATFILHDHDPAAGAPDLWGLLRDAVCHAGRDRTGRIAVDDSKKLKGPNDGVRHPLRNLERGVLSFLPGEQPAASDDDLYARLGVRVPDRAWYASPVDLPLASNPDELRIARARLAREFARHRVRFCDLRCEAIDADEFNRQVERMGTKAAVNFCAAIRLVDAVWREFPDEHPRIVIDRHGGRTHYREALQQVFPDTFITVLAEHDSLSRYRIEKDGRLVTVSFVVDGDQKHLPVALASMTAKYVRELMMMRLNRFFIGHLPELKPTAGYYRDGRRYLREIIPLLPRLKIERNTLVRQR